MIYPIERIDKISETLDKLMSTIKKYDDLSLLEKEIGGEVQLAQIELNLLKLHYIKDGDYGKQ